MGESIKLVVRGFGKTHPHNYMPRRSLMSSSETPSPSSTSWCDRSNSCLVDGPMIKSSSISRRALIASSLAPFGQVETRASTVFSSCDFIQINYITSKIICTASLHPRPRRRESNLVRRSKMALLSHEMGCASLFGFVCCN